MIRELMLDLRSLARRPLFIVATVAMLSLGIGATTAVYSLVDGVLLTPLAFRQPDRLVTVQLVVPEMRERFPATPVSIAVVDAWRRGCERTCRELGTVGATEVILSGEGAPELLSGARVTPGFFELLGVEPLLGRDFGVDDGGVGTRIAMLTYGLWQRRYGGDPSVLGRVITLDEQAVEVVGILPAGFRFPRFEELTPIEGLSGQPQFFEPLRWSESEARSARAFDYVAVLRLPPDVTAAQAGVELNGILAEMLAGSPVRVEVQITQLFEQVVGEARRPLWLLLGAVAAVLLLVCASVSNMLGIRWLDRRRDLAVRRALGAPTRNVVGRVVNESLVLALAGGVGGMLVGSLLLRVMLAAMPAGLPRIEEVTMDGSVVAVLATMTLFCGVLCALAPVWRASRTDPMETLKMERGGARPKLTPGVFVGLEVALGVGLLVMTGLLLRSFVQVLNVDPGFHVDRILAADVLLPRVRYQNPGRITGFYTDLLRELENVPGVRVVGLTQRLPLEGAAFVDTLARFDDPRPSDELPLANYRAVNPDYLRATGVAVTRGRMFTEDDRQGRPIVISAHAATRLWPNEDPIGRLVKRGGNRPREVVGVTADARILNLEVDAGFVAYVPYWDFPSPTATIVVQTESDPTAVAGSITDTISGIDPALPVRNVRSMNQVFSDAVAERSFQLSLVGSFAVMGVLLMGLGIYGVVTTAIGQQRREIAVCLAMGATPRRVVMMAARYGIRPLAVGLVFGLAGAVAGSRMMTMILYEVAPFDPVVYALVTLVVLTVGVAACLVPAGRAAGISPGVLLKSE